MRAEFELLTLLASAMSSTRATDIHFKNNSNESSRFLLDNEHQDAVNVTPDTVLEGSIYRIRFNYLGPMPYNFFFFYPVEVPCILGDPGADSEGEGKSKRAEKYGTKKSKERREQPLGTMSYQTSCKRSPPFWLLIGPRKCLCFSAQSEARTACYIDKCSKKI